MATKLKDLEAQLRKAREDADAWLDLRAAEIAKTSPGVPVGIVRQTICVAEIAPDLTRSI